MLNELRIIVMLTCLGVAAYQDLRERLVDDRVWFSFFPVGIALSIIDFFLKPQQLFYILCSFCVASFVALIVAVLVKSEIIGSADLISICYVAASMPLYINHFPIFDFRKLKHPFFPISVILNSCLMSLAIIPYNIMRNIEHLISGKNLFKDVDAGIVKRVIVFLLATPVRMECVRSGRFIPMEINEAGRRITILPKINNGSEINEEIWATVGIPMVFLHLISFILSLIFGGVLL